MVLTGTENFSCGAHTGELAGLSSAELGAFITEETGLCDDVAVLPCVTIAAIKGACIGNGAELALACEHRPRSGCASTSCGHWSTRSFAGTGTGPRTPGPEPARSSPAP